METRDPRSPNDWGNLNVCPLGSPNVATEVDQERGGLGSQGSDPYTPHRHSPGRGRGGRRWTGTGGGRSWTKETLREVLGQGYRCDVEVSGFDRQTSVLGRSLPRVPYGSHSPWGKGSGGVEEWGGPQRIMGLSSNETNITRNQTRDGSTHTKRRGRSSPPRGESVSRPTTSRLSDSLRGTQCLVP